VQKSYDIITDKVDNGFYDKKNVELPDEMIPMVVDDETEWLSKFKENEFDLIVSNMTLHWVNRLEDTFNAYKHTLEPDGVFIASALGGDTLQELRICFNLAE
jgi:NADH dehydrogenase [ubiquinone] 1 alpha subcomplex assembly factor 5